MSTTLMADNTLVAEAMHLTGIKTKRQVIDAALRAFSACNSNAPFWR